jgi:alpha-maltose-1-phosphate synthase
VTRVVHVISELSVHEAMGRTIAEVAERVPGEHHLLAARIHDGTQRFASAEAVGGSLTAFTWQRADALHAAVERIQPEVVHLHGGAFTPLWARTFRGRPVVQTLYGWPRLPGPAAARHATPAQLCRSNVVRPRVLVSTALPPALVARLLRAGDTRAVLSPDPSVVSRLAQHGVMVRPLPSGASEDHRRATFRPEAPVVLFAGRSETVRGIDVLLRALPLVRQVVPDARLRLLLLPTVELPSVLQQVHRSGLGGAVEVTTTAVGDLADELAAAQVGAWPFKFDYTTSPPAMAVAEAMAVGLPVVSTPVACVRAVAEDGRNADLVPVGDHRALAVAIAALLTDRERWTARAAAGLATVRGSASWAAAARVVADAYATATAEHRSGLVVPG